MSDNLGPALFVSLVGLSLIGAGYYVGMHMERREWHKYLPPAMEKMCQECAGIK